MPELLPHSPLVRVVFNPAAGQAEGFEREIQAAIAIWRSNGWKVELTPTQGPGDATRLAREAAEQGYDVVIAAGGDGTVNEVVNGLVHTKTALGSLPIGTVNVWVRELGLPIQPRLTAEALVKTQIRSVDVGRAGNRYFLLMAGVGFDAAVVQVMNSKDKRRFGFLAYVMKTISTAWEYRGTRARLLLDGKLVRSHVQMIILGNSQLYGGLLKVTGRASLNDGMLDVCIIKGKNILSILFRAIAIFMGRQSFDSDMEYHRARVVFVKTRRHMPIQIDGDHGGFTPMVFEAVPQALRVLMPMNVSTDLLRAEKQTNRQQFVQRFPWQRRS